MTEITALNLILAYDDFIKIGAYPMFIKTYKLLIVTIEMFIQGGKNMVLDNLFTIGTLVYGFCLGMIVMAFLIGI